MMATNALVALLTVYVCLAAYWQQVDVGFLLSVVVALLLTDSGRRWSWG